MNDLIKLLRGQRIDGRGTDEIMRLAADEIESLRSRLARLEEVYVTTVDCWKADGERLAEAESTLEHIRDSTYRSAVVLRGIAADYFDRRRTS